MTLFNLHHYMDLMSCEQNLRIKSGKIVKLYVKIFEMSERKLKKLITSGSYAQKLRIKSEKIKKLYVRIGKMSAVEYKKRSEAARCEHKS